MGNDVDDGREQSRSWRRNVSSVEWTATRPPPSKVKGRGKCKSRARIRTRDGWRHEPTWSGVEEGALEEERKNCQVYERVWKKF